MIIIDADGAERDWEWVKEKYNLPPIIEAPRDKDHWEVVELHESIGPASMTVRLVGDKVVGVLIEFGWPDGLDFQETNAEGHTGFGMGPGAYYDPEERYGPHFVAVNSEWVTDVVQGLGMIGKTNHAHLEPTFQFVKGEEQPEPGPSDNTREALVALLNGLEDVIFYAREVLERD